MKPSEATNLGCEMAGLIQTNRLVEAHQRLAPILAARTPFALLDRIGEAIGRGTGPAVNEFLDQVAAGRSMGGWPMIGSALRQQLGGDLHGAFERCQAFIIQGDTWYATDSLGERVPGPALVDQFEAALYLLARWGEHQNRWVRRAVGVSVHLWAKRARGDAEKAEQAGRLLGLLEALFSEGDMDAVKGIGWGLKTLGRYYPELTADWLRHQVANRPYGGMMLRKALTYLPPEQRASIEKAARGERSR